VESKKYLIILVIPRARRGGGTLSGRGRGGTWPRFATGVGYLIRQTSSTIISLGTCQAKRLILRHFSNIPLVEKYISLQ
jgi:hypothetical protein